jgi:hypothetical protein
MKEIKAYIRVERAAKAHAVLSEAGISHMTLSIITVANASHLIKIRTAAESIEAL